MPRLSTGATHTGSVQWFLDAMGAMLHCTTDHALLDLAYEAIRSGLGFDRVGILTVDRAGGQVVERLGTDARGRKFVDTGRVYPLHGTSHVAGYVRDPRMAPDGPGYVLQRDVATQLPAEARATLDGSPDEVLRVALRTSDAVVGFISVDNLTSGRRITEAAIEPLVAFATALALALENVWLVEARNRQIDQLDADVRRRDAQLDTLREIARDVNEAVTLDNVLDIVYDGVRYGLDYDRVGIVVLDHERGLFEERRGTDEQGNKTVPIDRILPLAGQDSILETPDLQAFMRGEEFYYTADMYEDTPPDKRYLLDGEPRHNLAVPLRTGKILTGLISVDNFVTGRSFGPEAAGPLIALANLVGAAIEKARLLERERTERARLEVLLETAHALNSTLDSDQILRELAIRLVEVVGASVAYFSHVDRHAQALQAIVMHAVPSFQRNMSDAVRSTPDHYATIDVLMDRGHPLVGIVDDPATVAEEAFFLRDQHLHAELLIPLIVQGRAEGVLEIYWEERVAIPSDLVDLCVAIAEQAAVAMRNAGLYAQVALRAERDPLTDLLNHRAIQDQLQHRINLGAPFVVLIVDVNHFKSFNDRHGHLVGDAVLVQIAGCLRTASRDGDDAGRYGGDEFVLILRDAGLREAEIVGARLDVAVRSLVVVQSDGAPVPLSVSIGSACFPHDGTTATDLLHGADLQMYAAKRRSLLT